MHVFPFLPLRKVTLSSTEKQCCGSGVRRLFDPGSGDRFFDGLMAKFWVKRTIIFFLFKNKIIYNFIIFVATKNGRKKEIFPLLFFVMWLDPGSENRDPGWIKIRIRDKHRGSATLQSSGL
jgi:hypothetical protein